MTMLNLLVNANLFNLWHKNLKKSHNCLQRKFLFPWLNLKHTADFAIHKLVKTCVTKKLWSCQEKSSSRVTSSISIGTSRVGWSCECQRTTSNFMSALKIRFHQTIAIAGSYTIELSLTHPIRCCDPSTATRRQWSPTLEWHPFRTTWRLNGIYWTGWT